MILRRGGRPGLIGLAARAAVVAGTSSAVSGRANTRQQNRAQAHGEQEQDEAAQQQADIDAAAGTDVLTQLQKLAELKQAGLLTDEEFAAAKAQLLG